MYKIIKDMQPSNKKEINAIRDEHGRMLTRKEEVLQRFAEYIEELYEDNRDQSPELDLEELQSAEIMNPIGAKKR